MNSFNSDQIAQMEKFYRVRLINSIAGYKPINLLGTISGDGVTNLCPVSSVFHMGSSPPLLGLVMRPERPNNDTLRNIRTTGQYTLNNVLPEFYLRAHQTSASFPTNVSEFDECGLTKQYYQRFKAPFVMQSNLKVGLEMIDMIDIEANGTTIVVGEIVHILADGDLIEEDGAVNHSKAESLIVSGLDTYCRAAIVGRVPYAKPGLEPVAVNVVEG